MSRLVRAWGAMSRERRLAAAAAVALLVTMFFPWYGLQSVGPKGVIYSHNINAFGDISFVEAAIFLVAAGVMVLLFARAEQREFNLPGGDGTIVAIAGGWSTLLIFYRVFSRPAGHGYPVGIQWGFFLAFVASGSLAYAGWRMRHGERPEAPARRRSQPPTPAGPVEETDARDQDTREAGHPRPDGESARRRSEETDETAVVPVAAARRTAGRRDPVPAQAPPARRERPRYPPRPGDPEQLSFEDPPAGGE
ncbi:MAG: hypothetical protein JWM60_10 [Solirubrobacterales bacterium]|jgi:hypothetical protein|nr:hypothetical protein [Solirubrobacterales bacterium]